MSENKQPPPPPSLFRAMFISLGLAGLVLVTVVLPAEYGLDPTGSGELLGIAGLSVDEPADLFKQNGTLRHEQRAFTLAPFESIEYKYRLEKGEALVYSWQAETALIYDFHAEPDGAEEGFAESFSVGRIGKEAGAFVAPFSGIHGWFWENRSQQNITVSLDSSGYFTASKLYTGGQVFDTAFE